MDVAILWHGRKLFLRAIKLEIGYKNTFFFESILDIEQRETNIYEKRRNFLLAFV